MPNSTKNILKPCKHRKDFVIPFNGEWGEGLHKWCAQCGAMKFANEGSWRKPELRINNLFEITVN